MLSPLEGPRSVTDAEDRAFALRCWPGIVTLEPHETRKRRVVALLIAYGIGFFFVIPWAITRAFLTGAPRWWQIGWAAFGGLVVTCGVIDLLRMKWRSSDKSLPARLSRWLSSVGAQQLYLLLGIVVGVVLPAAAIFFATDAWSTIDALDSGTSVADRHLLWLTLIGRLLQLVFVGIASLTPALLFFVFDREHLKTLRHRFMRQIMRFDKSVSTRQQVTAKYGDAMDEAYGRDLTGKILPGRRSPVLLATLLISLGWTYILLHGNVKHVDARGISSLFDPRLTAASFAFLGAYFYALNDVLRAYVRRDLRAKTYSALTVRILIVVVLAWVLDLAWDGTTLYVLAFLAGIFPETALVLIAETARRALHPLGSGPRFGGDDTDPLTRLEGIDLYDLARLFDEGVTNVQGLAYDDIVELMLQTRIPVPRILDWLDQAILYLHAGPAPRKADGNGAARDGKGPARAPAAVQQPAGAGFDRAATLATLRQYGIRTATDLFNAYDAAKKDDLPAFLKILPDAETGARSRIQTMIDVMADEEWIGNLRHWREAEQAAPETKALTVVSLPPGLLAAAYPSRKGEDPVEVVDLRTIRVAGSFPVMTFNQRFHAGLPSGSGGTVAGLVASQDSAAPSEGARVEQGEWRFQLERDEAGAITSVTATGPDERVPAVATAAPAPDPA